MSGKRIDEYSVRVFYEDVDLGGIVYHSRYLNFCERARSDIFFSRGLSPVEGEHHFVAKRIEADYLSPGRFKDLLVVHTRLKEKTRASLTLTQTVYHEETMTRLFEMDILLVCLKGSRVSAIPPKMMALFEEGT